MSIPTFRTWLLAHADRADPIGDLARDAAHDSCWTGTTTRSFLAHLARHHAPSRDAALTAEVAVGRYRHHHLDQPVTDLEPRR